MRFRKINLNRHLLFKIFIVLCNLFLVILCGFANFGKPLLILALLTNILIIWEFRKIQPAVLMGVFFLTYLLYLIPYYFDDYLITAHFKYYKIGLYNQVLGIHVLFLSSLYLFLDIELNKDSFKIRDLIKPRNNYLIFTLLYIIMLFIILSIKGQSVLGSSGGSYSTYVGNLEQQGGSVEYFYIFFVIAFFFTTKEQLRLALIFLVLMYCYVTITRGYRIQFIQMAILSFVLFFDGRVKTFYVIIMSFLGFIVTEIVNILKMAGSVSLEQILNLFNSSDQKVLYTNQTDVFYSSVAFIGLIKDGIYSIQTRALSAIGFLFNCFVPSSLVWKEARVPLYALDYTDLGGGGLISAYFYVWFGYAGTIFIGFFLAKLINKTYSSKIQNTYKIIPILVFSLYPRWFAYDPGNFLMRFSLYILVLYIIFIFIHRAMIPTENTELK